MAESRREKDNEHLNQARVVPRVYNLTKSIERQLPL